MELAKIIIPLSISIFMARFIRLILFLTLRMVGTRLINILLSMSYFMARFIVGSVFHGANVTFLFWKKREFTFFTSR
jgi:hypothetical protein